MLPTQDLYGYINMTTREWKDGLLSNISLPQVRKDGVTEPAIFTSGDDVATVARFLALGATSYKAADVIERLLGAVAQA